MHRFVLILFALVSPPKTHSQGYGPPPGHPQHGPHPQQGHPQHPQQGHPQHPQQGHPQHPQGHHPQQGPPPCEYESYDPTGTYESPGYPDGYPNRAECKYRFFTDKTIDVIFESFALEETRDCNYDYLNVVFDAISPDAKPQRYCGDGLDNIGGGNISGKGPLVMVFASDDSTVLGGFKFTYQFQIFGPDPCLSEPCQNGGTCDRLTDDYRCLCEAGYAGHHCELDIDECASHPCKHGGKCEDQLLGYTCECVDDFTGEQCENPPDRCEFDPCYNDGICVSRIMDFVCSCPVTHDGDLCEIEVTTTPPPTTTTTTIAVTTTAVPESGDGDSELASDNGGKPGSDDGIEIEPIPNEDATGSSGAAAAAVIICLVALAVIGVLAWYWFKRQRKSRDTASEESIMDRNENRHKGGKNDKTRAPPENFMNSNGNSKHFDLLNELQRISQEIILEENVENPKKKKKHKQQMDEQKPRRHNEKSDQTFATELDNGNSHDTIKMLQAQGLKPMKNIDLSPEDAARVLNQLLGKKRPRHDISPQEARIAMEHVRQRKLGHDEANPSILSLEEHDSHNQRRKRLKGRQARSIQKIPNHSPIQEESVTYDESESGRQNEKKNAMYNKRYLQPQKTLDPGRKPSKGQPTIETEDGSDSSMSGPRRGQGGSPLVETDITLEDFVVNDGNITEVRSAFRPIHRNPYKPPPLPVTENKAKSLVDKLVRPPIRSNENVVGPTLGVQRQNAFMD